MDAENFYCPLCLWNKTDLNRRENSVSIFFHGYHPSYRSLTVDEWIDGSCLKTNGIENTSKRVLESSDAVTIWKSKLLCQKFGFAYALFSQKGSFCQNAIRKHFDNDKCTYQCSGNLKEKCGSNNFSNVDLTTGNLSRFPRWIIFQ